MLQLLRGHRYELIAFLTGGAVMMLEIIGARLTAPHFGTSTYVWTAIIGVILGALAAGYALGGSLADKYDPRQTLPILLVLAAVMTAAIGLTQRPMLELIAGFELDLRLGALLAALVLFAPASLLIGLVSPHLAKIRIISLDSSGKSVGRLEASGAIGSIVGTFACGYFLLGMFGSRQLVLGVAVVLLLASFLAAGRGLLRLRLSLLAGVIALSLLVSSNPPSVLADIDTPYDRYTVSRGTYGATTALFLSHDNFDIQSVVDPTSPRTPLLVYVQRFNDAARNFGSPKDVLVIGGGAYTFPSMLVEHDDKIRVDVAEIDDRLHDVAATYFSLSESPRLQSYAQDGRTYLNTSAKKYDMIFVDAFSSLTPPFQLATTEAANSVRGTLRPKGVAVANIIDDAATPDFASAMYATYRQAFKYVAIYPADYMNADSSGRQNFILYASDDAQTLRRTARTQLGSTAKLNPNGLVMTDNYAPVERLLN